MRRVPHAVDRGADYQRQLRRCPHVPLHHSEGDGAVRDPESVHIVPYGQVNGLGDVSDSMCGKKHMIPRKTDAQCVQECIKSGSSYELVAGTKVYRLAAKPQTIAPFAGKQVHIEGDVKGSTITVTSISEVG